MTIILGIDPGSRITGYGLIKKISNNKFILVESGCIKINVIEFSERLKMIYNEINKIIKKFHPSFFAIEQVFISHNANSALKLGKASAAAIVAAAKNNLPVFEYANCLVKKIIVGNGKAKKKQIQNSVCKILKLVIKKIQPDAADALAIAITHYYLNKNK